MGRIFFSTKSRPRSTARLTLVSASIGILVGAGYGGYTHYKVNSKKKVSPTEQEEYAYLKELPSYKPHYKVSQSYTPVYYLSKNSILLIKQNKLVITFKRLLLLPLHILVIFRYNLIQVAGGELALRELATSIQVISVF